jgi:biotin operon repressor
MSILIESFDDITAFAHPQYLVKPLLELGSTAMIFGASGSGKTFCALDLACSIATGLPWAGMATKEMPVVYITAEGNRAFGRRVRAWHMRALATRLAEGAEGHERFTDTLRMNLHVVRSAVQVGEPLTRMELIAAIREKVSADQPLGLSVVDTLARCSIGFEEKDNSDMTRFVDALVDLKTRLRATGRMDGHNWNPDAEDDAYEPVIMVVHHTGHTPANDSGWVVRERGASALRGALDVVLGIEEGGDTTSLAVHKMKDGEEPLPMAVTWDDSFVVGEDEDGVDLRGRVAVVLPPGSARTAEEERAAAKGEEWTALEADIMRLMVERPDCSMSELADDLDVSKATIGRRVLALRKAGKVVYEQGEYKVVPASRSPFLQ